MTSNGSISCSKLDHFTSTIFSYCTITIVAAKISSSLLNAFIKKPIGHREDQKYRINQSYRAWNNKYEYKVSWKYAYILYWYIYREWINFEICKVDTNLHRSNCLQLLLNQWLLLNTVVAFQRGNQLLLKR